MNTTSLISTLAQTLSLSKTETAQRLENTVVVLTAELVKTHTVALDDLGTFEVEKLEEQISVDPSSGRRMLIPPQLIVRFTPANAMKGGQL
jgi:nucleoid DNA-binding protein